MNYKMMYLKEIKPAEYNPRITLTKSDFEYKALKASMDTFGLVVPLIVNQKTGTLISGHQRLNILLQDGVEQAEVVIVDMEPEKEKALCIAMNRVEGLWDYGKLADILEELKDIAMITTGFCEEEVAELLGELENLPEVEMVDKRADTKEKITCMVGEYKFYITDKDYKDMIADIKEKLGFSAKVIEKELKRRILLCLSKH